MTRESRSSVKSKTFHSDEVGTRHLVSMRVRSRRERVRGRTRKRKKECAREQLQAKTSCRPRQAPGPSDLAQPRVTLLLSRSSLRHRVVPMEGGAPSCPCCPLFQACPAASHHPVRLAPIVRCDALCFPDGLPRDRLHCCLFASSICAFSICAFSMCTSAVRTAAAGGPDSVRAPRFRSHSRIVAACSRHSNMPSMHRLLHERLFHLHFFGSICSRNAPPFSPVDGAAAFSARARVTSVLSAFSHSISAVRPLRATNGFGGKKAAILAR